MQLGNDVSDQSWQKNLCGNEKPKDILTKVFMIVFIHQAFSAQGFLECPRFMRLKKPLIPT